MIECSTWKNCLLTCSLLCTLASKQDVFPLQCNFTLRVISFETRMRYSRMHTVRRSRHLSCNTATPPPPCMPLPCTPPPHMSPAMHTPLSHMSPPAMHAPYHACPCHAPPCHAGLHHTCPPAMLAPCHAHHVQAPCNACRTVTTRLTMYVPWGEYEPTAITATVNGIHSPCSRRVITKAQWEGGTSLLPLRQGNVFTPVCHSVHRDGAGRYPLGRHPPADPPPGQTPPGRTPAGQTPPQSDTPQADTPQADTPPSGQKPPQDGYCSGRYASHWNAFFLTK